MEKKKWLWKLQRSQGQPGDRGFCCGGNFVKQTKFLRESLTSSDFAFSIEKMMCLATTQWMKKVNDFKRNIFKHHKREWYIYWKINVSLHKCYFDSSLPPLFHCIFVRFLEVSIYSSPFLNHLQFSAIIALSTMLKSKIHWLKMLYISVHQNYWFKIHYAATRKDNLSQHGVLTSEIIFLRLVYLFPICFHHCCECI